MGTKLVKERDLTEATQLVDHVMADLLACACELDGRTAQFLLFEELLTPRDVLLEIIHCHDLCFFFFLINNLCS